MTVCDHHTLSHVTHMRNVLKHTCTPLTYSNEWLYIQASLYDRVGIRTGLSPSLCLSLNRPRQMAAHH